MGFRKSYLFCWPFVALVFAVSFNFAHSLAVISVDLGSEWMKVAIVSVSFLFACLCM